MTIAICDDEQHFLGQLKGLLNSCCDGADRTTCKIERHNEAWVTVFITGVLSQGGFCQSKHCFHYSLSNKCV